MERVSHLEGDLGLFVYNMDGATSAGWEHCMWSISIGFKSVLKDMVW